MRSAWIVGGSGGSCDDGRVEMGDVIIRVALPAGGGWCWDKRVLRTVDGGMLPHAWVCC